MNTIAFPGLGLSFEIDPVAFTLFDIEIKWYGVILTLGIMCAFLTFYLYGRKTERIPEDHLYNLALIAIPCAIVGARFFYVVTSWDKYKDDLLQVFNIRAGGLAIYGGVIFGAAVLFLYTHFAKLDTWKLLDAVGPALLVGQIIGRWGNFVNAEAFGSSKNVADWFLRMEITYKTGDKIICHPTFLYESLWNLVGLLAIFFLFYPRKKFDGEIFCLYLGWYGIGRSWIEVLRTDSLYIFGGHVKFSIFVGICSVILAIIAFILLPKRQKRLQEEANYTGKFAAAEVKTLSLRDDEPQEENLVEGVEEDVEIQVRECDPQPDENASDPDENGEE